MPKIHETYRDRTPGSAALAERACAVLPGGDTRSTTYHSPYPLTIERGEGAFVWDVDGHRYLDLIGNVASLVHGHAYPPIVEAVQAQVSAGTAWPARSLPQLDLAEQLIERVRSVERVRFVNSGTEAGMLARQIATRVTGRPLVLMSRFGYHGWSTDFMAGTEGSGNERTLLAPFGDAAAFERVLAEHGREIAAVFVEGGTAVVPPPDFFPRVQAAARAAGALFVLDEVVTFRLSRGGAQELYGIAPDLTMFGKLIGGGFPVGAVGGRADLVDVTDPRRPDAMFNTGTFSGNPVTCAAGAVAVRELTPERIATMDKLAERLSDGIEKAGAEAGVPTYVMRAGSVTMVRFIEGLPRRGVDPAADPDVARAMRLSAAFHLASLNHGLFFFVPGMIILSTVMDDAYVDEASQRFRNVFADVAAEVA